MRDGLGHAQGTERRGRLSGLVSAPGRREGPAGMRARTGCYSGREAGDKITALVSSHCQILSRSRTENEH